jgi:subtilisin family serine protease
MDGHGHGTHCAGTVGGKTVGIAKKVNLHAVKVMDDRGNGGTSKILMALDWIAANGKRPSLISMSLGAPGKSAAMKVSMDKVVAANIVPIVAAGNNRVDSCEYSPAYIPEAVTVGAMAADSSYASRYSNFGACVDIWAPGGALIRGQPEVYSAYKGSDSTYEIMCGTSMATPHVSGVAALMLQVDPGLGAKWEMEKALIQYSTKDILRNLPGGSPNRLLYSTCFKKEDMPPKETTTTTTTTTTTPPPTEPPPESRRRSPRRRRRRRRTNGDVKPQRRRRRRRRR